MARALYLLGPATIMAGLLGCATGAGQESGGVASGATSATSTTAATTTAATTSSATSGGGGESATSGTGGAGGALQGSGGSGGSGGGASGSGGSGPLPNTVLGCADATREGFTDYGQFKYIAACGGAWDQPGIFNMPATCNYQAGNSGLNPAGTGCTVSDLCAPGWHVCFGRDDVVLKNPGGCAGVMDGAVSPVFFTTQMSSTGAFNCAAAANAANDLFGCGDLGCDFTSNATVQALCAPLVMSSHDQCKGLRNDLACGDWCNHLGKYPNLSNAWACGADTTAEALNVTKSAPDQQGGVLCCIDD